MINKRKPVILQVLPTLESGGVERGTLEVASAISRAGYVSLVASSGGRMVPKLAALGTQHIPLPLHSKNPLTIWNNHKRLLRVIDEHQVDIIHARSRAPAWSAYWAAQKARNTCHFVTTWHGTHSTKGLFKKRYNSIMGRGEKVIAVSEFIKQHMMQEYGFQEEAIEVIHRGVDVSQFDPQVPAERISRISNKLMLDHDHPVILLPGRLTRWKGHLFLLEALEKIKSLSWSCLFVGKGDEHSDYKATIDQKIVEYGLDGRVKLFDHVEDMPALYAMSDIVVSASLKPEAFGRVAAEAQAMQKLVIATNHGGACETIEDTKTGFLVEPNDATALARLLHKCLEMHSRTRKTITNRARKKMEEEFSLDTMQTKVLQLYQEILDNT